MRLTSNARFFISAKSRVRGIGVIAIDPDASGLNATPHTEACVRITAPHASAQTIFRVIGDGEGFLFRFKGCHGEDRAKNLLLEDSHFVMTLEDRRLNVETIIQPVA
ncbi:hypothetical protein DOFOFD_05410 [Acetobacteraceae bacterium EV16P]|uniref:Uncharacterized protein n=1 Tax=Sorlinia euscelidii TaxID=3081148 RepID=A0ABU7U0N4_9PROT